jgi:hypothetical protein
MTNFYVFIVLYNIKVCHIQTHYPENTQICLLETGLQEKEDFRPCETLTTSWKWDFWSWMGEKESPGTSSYQCILPNASRSTAQDSHHSSPVDHKEGAVAWWSNKCLRPYQTPLCRQRVLHFPLNTVFEMKALKYLSIYSPAMFIKSVSNNAHTWNLIVYFSNNKTDVYFWIPISTELIWSTFKTLQSSDSF